MRHPCAGRPAAGHQRCERRAGLADVERSRGLRARRAPRRRAAAASPASGGAAAATALHLVESAVAMQHHVAAGRERRARCARRACPTAPPSTCRRSSAAPRTRSNPRITSRTIVTEVVAGATGSMAVNTTCAVIPSGSSASGRNAAKSVASSSARSASTTGSRCVAVGRGAAVAGHVLEHRQHAALHQPCGDRRRRSPRPCSGVVAIGAVADHRVGAGAPARRRSAGNRRRCRARADRWRSAARRAGRPRGPPRGRGRRAAP